MIFVTDLFRVIKFLILYSLQVMNSILLKLELSSYCFYVGRETTQGSVKSASFSIKENVDVEERTYIDNNCKIHLTITTVMGTTDIIVATRGKNSKLNRSWKTYMTLKMRQEQV